MKFNKGDTVIWLGNRKHYTIQGSADTPGYWWKSDALGFFFPTHESELTAFEETLQIGILSDLSAWLPPLVVYKYNEGDHVLDGKGRLGVIKEKYTSSSLPYYKVAFNNEEPVAMAEYSLFPYGISTKSNIHNTECDCGSKAVYGFDGHHSHWCSTNKKG